MHFCISTGSMSSSPVFSKLLFPDMRIKVAVKCITSHNIIRETEHYCPCEQIKSCCIIQDRAKISIHFWGILKGLVNSTTLTIVNLSIWLYFLISFFFLSFSFVADIFIFIGRRMSHDRSLLHTRDHVQEPDVLFGFNSEKRQRFFCPVFCSLNHFS